MKRKLLSVALAFSLTIASLLPVNGLQAEAKTASTAKTEFVGKPETSMSADSYLEVMEDAGIPVLNAAESLEVNPKNTCPVDVTVKRYDPREFDRMTSVKDQGRYGLCWDFATQACAEQYLINMGKATTDIDFSESYFAYYLWKNYLVEDYSSWVGYLKDAGYNTQYYREHINENDYLPIAAESNYPYENLTKMSTLSDEEMENFDYKINKCYYVDYTIDEVNTVKSMIVNYGAVVGSYHDSVDDGILSDYYNNVSYNSEEDYNCYSPTNETCNHAITIVGWDDDYAASNFAHTPEGDGAWLCKNSWGTGRYFGNGYFWLSYYNQDNYGDTYSALSVVDKNTDTGKVNKSYELKLGKTLDLLADYPEVDLTKTFYPTNVLERTENGFKGRMYGTLSLTLYDAEKFKLGDINIKIVGDPESFTLSTGDVEKYYPVNGIRSEFVEVTATFDGKTIAPELTSSDSSVVEIYYNYYQILDFGNATITASFCDDYATGGIPVTKTFEVRVAPMCQSLKLTKRETSLDVDGEERIGVTTNPVESADRLRYTSANPDIVTVDETGKMKAVKAGVTSVTVETTDGSKLSATISVTVKEKPTTQVTTEEKSTEKTTQVTTEEESTEKTTQVTTEEKSTEKTTQVTTEEKSTEKTTQVTTEEKSTEKTTQVTTEEESTEKPTENNFLVDKEDEVFIVAKESEIRLAPGERYPIQLLAAPSNRRVVYRSENINIVTVDQNGVLKAGMVQGDTYVDVGYEEENRFHTVEQIRIIVRARQEDTTEAGSHSTNGGNSTNSQNNMQTNIQSNAQTNTQNNIQNNVQTNTQSSNQKDTAEARYINNYDWKNLYYTVDTKNKKATVTGVVNAKKKTYTVPDTVSYKGERFAVYKIEKNAFSKCSRATKITIGKNVTNIASKAFAKCKNLSSIMIKTNKLTAQNVSKTAFKGLSGSVKATVPKKNRKVYRKLLKQKGFSGKVKES